MKNELLISIKALLLLTSLTGICYPLFITIIGQSIMNEKANGSLIRRGDVIIGSSLIAQKFIGPEYFHSRPSSIDYNPNPSGASNLSLTSKTLLNQFEERKKLFYSDNKNAKVIPSEMLFSSGSGVDPHISKRAAFIQTGRILEARNLSISATKTLTDLIESSTDYPQFGILGEERVNVLELNIKLDQVFKSETIK